MTRERAIERLLEMQKNCARAIATANIPKDWEEDFKERLDVFDVAIDALREEKHGQWLESEQSVGWSYCDSAECSVCGEDFILGEYDMDEIREYFKYCPNCGAIMDVRE